MATLGDVLSEIFAPRPEVGGPSMLGGPETESLSTPGSSISENYSVKPQSSGLLDILKGMFASTPQPPDGMDERTYAPGKPVAAPPVVASPQSPPQTWPDPPHYRPDTDEGYSKTFGNVNPQDNDPARAALLAQSVDTSGPAPGARAPRGLTPNEMPPFRTTVEPAPAAPQSGQPNQSEELARIFRAFFAGAAGVNPTSPKFSAFAQGASGAMKTQFDERQKEALLKRQTAKDALEETLKLSKHDRDEDLADSLIGYRKRKTNVDANGVRLQDIGKFNEIKNNVNRDYKRALDLINKDYSLDPAAKKKAQDEARTERDSRLNEIEQQYRQRSLTPDMGKVQQKGEQKPAQSGDGKSPQSPVMTKDPKVIQGLQKGDYYINPADGQVYQKN